MKPRTRLTRAQHYPHVVRLPKIAKSPTGSIYKLYDIAHQEAVLQSYEDAPYVVRSAEPFVLRVQTGKTARSIKMFFSKMEAK